MGCKNIDGAGGVFDWSGTLKSRGEFSFAATSSKGTNGVMKLKGNDRQVHNATYTAEFLGVKFDTTMTLFQRCLLNTHAPLEVQIRNGGCCDRVEVACISGEDPFTMIQGVFSLDKMPKK